MTRDTFRNVLGGWIIGSFTGALAALYLLPIPSDNKDLIVFMLGQLSGFVGAVIAFNYGTTKSSADKTAVIANLADGPSASGKPGDPVHVTEDTP
jgi:hypothetical protein